MISDLSIKSTLINQGKEKQHLSDLFKNRKTRKVFTAQRALYSSNFKKKERDSTGESELITCETDKEISFITISDLNSILLSDVEY